jgi:hypothetical protein
MREPQRLQHCKNADNLMSNHIYRDSQSIATAGNKNKSIKCIYFSDIRLGKRLQSLEVSDMKRWWRIFGGEMSVRTSLATRRGAQIFGPPRTPVLQAAVTHLNIACILSLSSCTIDVQYFQVVILKFIGPKFRPRQMNFFFKWIKKREASLL